VRAKCVYAHPVVRIVWACVPCGCGYTVWSYPLNPHCELSSSVGVLPLSQGFLPCVNDKVSVFFGFF